MVTVNNYYNNISVGRDLNNLPNTSSTGTTVGYQYDGLTEEDRFVQKVLAQAYHREVQGAGKGRSCFPRSEQRQL